MDPTHGIYVPTLSTCQQLLSSSKTPFSDSDIVIPDKDKYPGNITPTV